ncbi:hypothetical protein PCASD_11706 [Puccinia coronata f. sp. avenae]|uniref:Uncharacterized protein n=1 Tax=Puccinia coronata f. sp. avenae TaxID=200324 RepID=A0A2N5UMG5_9BASI|nr:hypothetical protein PCASD_11706 [Puccinia coronata f. sp. avenae]
MFETLALHHLFRRTGLSDKTSDRPVRQDLGQARPTNCQVGPSDEWSDQLVGQHEPTVYRTCLSDQFAQVGGHVRRVIWSDKLPDMFTRWAGSSDECKSDKCDPSDWQDQILAIVKLEAKPMLNGCKPMLNGCKPMLNGCKPMLNGCKPMLNGCKPMLNGCKPMLNGCKPMLNGCKPMLNGCKPMLNGCKPMLNGCKPMLNGVNPC